MTYSREYFNKKAREYYQRNKDEINRKSKIYYSKTREERLKKQKKYAALHRVEILAYQKEYKKNNPNKIKEWKKKNWKSYLARPEVHQRIKLKRNKWMKTAKGIYCTIKARCRSKIIEIESQNKFIEWYNAQIKECFYCGISEAKIASSNFRIKRLTIDKINPFGAYLIDNMRLACPICNWTKSNYITYDQMIEIGKCCINKLWKKLA